MSGVTFLEHMLKQNTQTQPNLSTKLKAYVPSVLPW